MRRIAVAVSLVLAALLASAPAGAAPADRVAAADKWLEAIVVAARSGDLPGLRAAVGHYIRAVRNALGGPPGLKVAAERVREATRRHLKVLQELLERVPSSARPAIEKAIEAASRGYEEATAALGKGVPQGESPAEKRGRKGRR